MYVIWCREKLNTSFSVTSAVIQYQWKTAALLKCVHLYRDGGEKSQVTGF